MKESPHPVQAQKCSNCNAIRKTQKPNRLSSQGLVAQPTGTIRIRTSHVSFRPHAIPGTTCPGLYGSSRLPLPTSQSCRKRAFVSPDPCNPMTNNASLPTLFSSELLATHRSQFSDRQAFSSAIMCRPIQGTCCFRCFDWDAGPNPIPLELPMCAEVERQGPHQSWHRAPPRR